MENNFAWKTIHVLLLIWLFKSIRGAIYPPDTITWRPIMQIMSGSYRNQTVNWGLDRGDREQWKFTWREVWQLDTKFYWGACETALCARVVSPWGEAASPFCLGLKGEGGSAAVRGLFSLVSSTPLSFSDRPSAGGVSPFTGAWGWRDNVKES